MDTFERLKKLVSGYLPNPETPVTPQSDLISGLGLNSFEVVQIICDIEEEFGLDTEIPDEDIQKLRIVQDLVDYLNERTA